MTRFKGTDYVSSSCDVGCHRKTGWVSGSLELTIEKAESLGRKLQCLNRVSFPRSRKNKGKCIEMWL